MTDTMQHEEALDHAVMLVAGIAERQTAAQTTRAVGAQAQLLGAAKSSAHYHAMELWHNQTVATRTAAHEEYETRRPTDQARYLQKGSSDGDGLQADVSSRPSHSAAAKRSPRRASRGRT